MSRDLKVVGSHPTQRTLPLLAPILSQPTSPKGEDLSARVAKLQGSLKLLEREYRENLKEGFENKIKAYRLQAVAERKMLQQAMRQAQHSQQQQIIREKSIRKDSEPTRTELMRLQRERHAELSKKKLEEDKRHLAMSILQEKIAAEERNQQTHDKVSEQLKLGHLKRDYFAHLRKQSLQKEEETTKQLLLSRIIHNSERLNQMKQELSELQKIQKDHSPFLTI